MDNKHGGLPGMRIRRQKDCLGGAFGGLASLLMVHLSRDMRKGQRSATLSPARDLRDSEEPQPCAGEELLSESGKEASRME